MLKLLLLRALVLVGAAAGLTLTANSFHAIAKNANCGAYCPGPEGTGKPNPQHSNGDVGKADEKNPPGQGPNGSDGNHGFECDGNRGVGDGNPAHTGCASPSPSTTAIPTTTPSPVRTPTVTPTASATASSPSTTPTAGPTASAEPTNYPSNQPTTSPTAPHETPSPASHPAGTAPSPTLAAPSVPSSNEEDSLPGGVRKAHTQDTGYPKTLPATGANILTAVAGALLMILSGALLLRCTKHEPQ